MSYGKQELSEAPDLDTSLARGHYTNTKNGWALRIQGTAVNEGDLVNVRRSNGNWVVFKVGPVLWRTKVNTVAKLVPQGVLA